MRLNLLILVIIAINLIACCNRKESNPTQPDQQTLIDSSDYYMNRDTHNYVAGDTILPFEDFDFNNGNWKCVISISNEDFKYLSNGIPRKRNLSTSNISVLDKVKYWKFRFNNSDMATIQGSIKIIRDKVIVAYYEFNLDSAGMGLQSRRYGWISSVDSSDIIKTIQLFDY